MVRRRAPVLVLPALAIALVLAALVGLAAGPVPAAAQDDCEWLAPSGDFVREGVLNRTRVRTPHVVCRDGVRIRADSARYYDSSNYYELFGNVLYEDAQRTLRGRRVQYYRGQGRLQAQQDVRLTRRSDNALVTGEQLVYTEGPGGVGDVLVVTGGRPHAVLYITRDTARSGDPAPDTAGAPPAPQPWEVDADRIEMEGEERFEASGNVEITRDSLEAFGDRAVYASGEGTLTLLGRARMIDAGYTLEGDTIDAVVPGNVVEEVVARRRAVLTGEELDVRAPRIRMLMGDGTLDRLVAVTGRDTAVDTLAPEPTADDLGGAPPPPATDAALMQAEHPARPVARAQDFVVVADSVDVRVPGEELERLVAVGRAHAESSARDSIAVEGLPELARRDWMEGREIEAIFSRAPAPAPAQPDTARGEYRLESLTARGSARSLYRMVARDTAAAATPEGGQRPAVHYVVGDTIVLTMDQGSIRTMDVVGQVRGIHWEPVGQPALPPPDTSGAPPADTTGATGAGGGARIGDTTGGGRP